MEARWRIKEFGERTAVPEATLRAWERRYGLLAPERTSGGYRLYSAADERRVIAMQAHLARGLAAAQAASAVLGEEPHPPAPRTPQACAAELLDAVEAFDASRADAAIAGAFALSTATAIAGVLMPTLAEIGRRWASGDMTIAHEHFASHLVERRLLAGAAGWQSGPGRLALLACPPLERHTLGLLCLGVALADRGWRVSYLGADTPIAEISRAADRMDPDAVIMSAIVEERFTDHAIELRALARAHRTVAAGAGATATAARRLRFERCELDPAAAAQAL